MKILSLNCQRGHQPQLKNFLNHILQSEKYDLLILQEADQKVISFLQHEQYGLVNIFNEEVKKDSELCIVYRRSYNLIKTGFKSFASMRNDPWHGFKHPSFGLLWADLTIENKPFRIGSIHLHSGIDRKARSAELKLAKELFLKDIKGPAIIAGDFNAGFPGESFRMANILEPELVWETRNIGPTLDSRYSENLPHLPNRIAAFLSLFNIRIPLWTDHVFVDQQTANTYSVKCSVLEDRVSDHNPVEFTINKN
jgi:endonuclease/exonuclease/phosphatase family metal-dependent hydrolase